MSSFHLLACRRILFRQAHYLWVSPHSRDPGSPLSATAALKQQRCFCCCCSSRTGKDRHLLLTTTMGLGGETQSLMSAWGYLLCFVEGGWVEGYFTTTPIPLVASSSHSEMKVIAVITATTPNPLSTPPSYPYLSGLYILLWLFTSWAGLTALQRYTPFQMHLLQHSRLECRVDCIHWINH